MASGIEPPYSLICTTPIKGCSIEEIKAVFSQYGRLHGEGILIPLTKKDTRIIIHYETVGSVLKAYQALNATACPALSCKLMLQYNKETRMKLMAMGLLDPSAARIIMPPRMPAGPLPLTPQPPPSRGGVGRSVSLIPKTTSTQQNSASMTTSEPFQKQAKRPLKPRLKHSFSGSSTISSNLPSVSTVVETAASDDAPITAIQRFVSETRSLSPKKAALDSELPDSDKRFVEIPSTETSSSSDSSSTSSSSSSSSSSASSSCISEDEEEGRTPPPLKDEFLKILSSTTVGHVPVAVPKIASRLRSEDNTENNSESDFENQSENNFENNFFENTDSSATCTPSAATSAISEAPSIISTTKSIGSEMKGPTVSRKKNLIPTDTATQQHVKISNQLSETQIISTSGPPNILGHGNEIKAPRKRKPNSSGIRKSSPPIQQKTSTIRDSSFMSLLEGKRSSKDIALAQTQERLSILGLIKTNNLSFRISEAKEHLAIHSGVFAIDPNPTDYELISPKGSCLFPTAFNGRLPFLIPTIPRLNGLPYAIVQRAKE